MWAPDTLPPGLGARELVIQTQQPATEDQGGPHRREPSGGRWRIKWMSHTHTYTRSLKYKHTAPKPVRTHAKLVYFNYGNV